MSNFFSLLHIEQKRSFRLDGHKDDTAKREVPVAKKLVEM